MTAIKPPAAPVAEAGNKGAAVIASEQLLQGRKQVEISHNGRIYRLQATKQGKLILTK